MNIPKYRKKPIVVEAMHISRFNYSEILAWGNGNIDLKYHDFCGFDTAMHRHIAMTITTSTGTHDAYEGDWIVKGINGQFYAMPDDTFKELYEPAENDAGNENLQVINWLKKEDINN